MLTKLSGILSDVDGKLGGSCFARNRYGLYMKNWVTPFNPQSPYQSLVRNNFRSLVILWQSLTEEQHYLWNELGKKVNDKNKLGETFHPSGFNIFLTLNQNLFLIGQTPISDAPAQPAVPSCTWSSFAYNNITNDITGTLTGGSVTADIYYTFEISRYYSPGRNYPPVNFGRFQYLDDSTLNWTILSVDYDARFSFPFLPGKRYFFRFKAIHKTTGFNSVPIVIPYLVPTVPGTFWSLDISRLDFTTILQ